MYWLVTTAHLVDGLWFRDDDDFKVGMNYVAIQAGYGKAVVLAFILMSNHVHFVLKETREEVLAFINAFKHRYSLYYSKKYGIREFLRRNDVDITPLPWGEEAIERAVAYVQMNCVAANICAHPSQYPWGTGNIFFNRKMPAGRSLGALPARERIRLLHSVCTGLPADWLVGVDGYILPESYVDVRMVEMRYRSARNMNYYLNTSSKARKKIEHLDEHLPAFRDQIILAALPDLLKSLFGKASFSALSPSEQTECLRQIRYRFSADINQVARVCGISYEDAAGRIDAS